LFQHTPVEDPQAFWDTIPDWGKHFVIENNIKLYGVDTIRIAHEACQNDASLIQRFQGIVLLGVFLRVTPFREQAGLTDEQLFEEVRKPIRKYFGRKGEQVVEDNLNAVRLGYRQVVEVPRSLMEATPAAVLEAGRVAWEAKGKDTNAFFI
jgi:pyruvate-ferredoxin/flavodoxin oxidoreductase